MSITVRERPFWRLGLPGAGKRQGVHDYDLDRDLLEDLLRRMAVACSVMSYVDLEQLEDWRLLSIYYYDQGFSYEVDLYYPEVTGGADLIEAIEADMSEAEVEPYLRENLLWRLRGEVEDITLEMRLGEDVIDPDDVPEERWAFYDYQ